MGFFPAVFSPADENILGKIIISITMNIKRPISCDLYFLIISERVYYYNLKLRRLIQIIFSLKIKKASKTGFSVNRENPN